MPDLDVLVRGLPAGWSQPFRLAQGENEVSLVAESLVRSLAADLRKRGLPFFPRLVEIVILVANGVITADTGRHLLRDLVRDQGGGRQVQVAARAVSSLIVAIERGEVSAPDAEAIARAVCTEMVESCFVAPAKPALEERLGRSAEDNDAWADSLRDAARDGINHVASAIVRDPSGKFVRAPRTSHSDHLTTAEMLALTVA